jgi:hypothetical protein
MSACRGQATAMVEHDRMIDNDIGSYDGRDYGDQDQLRARMDEFGDQRRFQDIVRECMRQLGYGEALPGELKTLPTAPPTGPAPAPAS